MMASKMKNTPISIFGEVEEIVARQMMAEGKGVGKLAPTNSVSIEDCPPTTRVNAFGDRARMVIVMPRNLMREFERRIEDLIAQTETAIS
jgi:hypothetical protein